MRVEPTKCECGHLNPIGTVLCESCGKPLAEALLASNEPLEMRYDGIARRSQKSSPSILDRIWRFFSSVKVAIYLIVITFLGAMLGTIYPQESVFIRNFNLAAYYKNTYGKPGEIYYWLGLSHTYESWWFISLLVMIGASLVICSLDRILPLYRALNKQQIRKHMQFLRRQKTVHSAQISGDAEQWVKQFATFAKKKHYKVTQDGTALLAEKNRFSRFGPYINHIGLILFLLAILARSIPGYHMDSYVSVPDGATVPINGTSYYLKSDKFTVGLYDEEDLPDKMKGELRVKDFVTEATLYECLENCGELDALADKEPVLQEVLRHEIRVNQPLSYKGLNLFQYDFDLTPKLNAVNPVLVDKTTGEEYGPFYLPMKDAQLHHELGPYTLEIYANYMEFTVGADGRPTTLSTNPVAPAFVFIIKGPNLSSNGETYMYFPMQKDKLAFSQDQLNAHIADKLEIKVRSMAEVDISEATSVLNVRVDRALPYLWVGAVFSMLGLIMGSYWQHRRIWLRVDEGQLTLGAHTNKNWYGLRSEVSGMLACSGIEVEPKMLDNGGNNA